MSEKSKGGRPKLNEAEKGNPFSIRLNNAQRARLEQAADAARKEAGVKTKQTHRLSVSDFAREQLLASLNLPLFRQKLIQLIEEYRTAPDTFEVEQRLLDLLDTIEGHERP